MKKIVLFLISLFFIPQAFTQIGIGTTTPDASAKLHISSTSQGILIPTMTTAERSAIAGPATGLLVFQTDGTPGFCYYNGFAWVNITNGYPLNSGGFAVSSTYGLTGTLAGTGSPGNADGMASAASFNNPRGIASDAWGNVYVADVNNQRIRKISTTGLVTTLAGTGSPGAADGAGTTATFTDPIDVAVDASGNVYVADNANHKIRKIITLANGSSVVSTLAGSGAAGSADGAGTAATFNFPYGVAADASGNVYVTDINHAIRKIAADGMVTTFAGSATAGSADGTGTAASFNAPRGLATDASGNIYVADLNNRKVRKITPEGVVTTLAGSGAAGTTDGVGAAATFNRIWGVTVDALGNVYVPENSNHKIRKISPTGVVTTLAGTGSAGAADGAGMVATFNAPYDVTTDAPGNVYVSDAFNHKIRKIIVY